MADADLVMTALATRLQTVPGLRAFSYPSDNPSPPAATVGLPEVIDFDQVMGRGFDRFVIPVLVLVSMAGDRASQALLAPYLGGSGPSSIKAAIEGDETLGGTVDSLRVTEARPAVYTVGGVDLLGCKFLIEIYG